jgi:hypothetical protein
MREAVEELNRVRPQRDFILKIGMHKGAAIAVTLNDRLDYFGQIVNIAARVQNLAGGDEICVTEDVHNAPGVANIFAPFVSRRTETELKGIDQPTPVFLLARRTPRNECNTAGVRYLRNPARTVTAASFKTEEAIGVNGQTDIALKIHFVSTAAMHTSLRRWVICVVTAFFGPCPVKEPISELPGAVVPDSMFVGEAVEGFIVDTDHWRHFFLILGLVWGLTAASINLRRSEWAEELRGTSAAAI